jgi:hypothetical protein
MPRVMRAALLLAALGVAVPAPPTALADGSGGAGGGEIWAGVQTGRVPDTDGTDASDCRWRPTLPHDAIIGGQGPVLRTTGGVTYQMFDRVCPTGTTLHWIPRLTPSSLAEHAADLLRARLPLPRPGFAPAADRTVVRVGTWFWTDPRVWRPVSITAWVPTPTGPLWATTTALPTRLVLDPGDGPLGAGPVACSGPGRIWQPTDGDSSASPCSYTYVHASAVHPSGRFPARVAIEWQISWMSSTGAGGPLAGHTTWAGQPVTVAEIQALVTR